MRILSRAFHKMSYIIMEINSENMAFQEEYPFNMSIMNECDIEKLPCDYFMPRAHKIAAKNLRKYPKLFTGYLFHDAAGNMIGYCWIIKKGANDAMFRIRETDVYLNEVYISKPFRGHGYGKRMLLMLLQHFQSENLTHIKLSVRKEKLQAIHCYESVGFQKGEKLDFFRILRMSVPYYTI